MNFFFSRKFRILVSLVLIFAVLYLVDGQSVWQKLRGVEPAWLLLAGAIFISQTVLMALRWRFTAHLLGMEMTRRNAIGEYFMAQFVNQTLPGGVLGDAGRAVRARKYASFKQAAHGVIIERMAGQIAMLILAAFGCLVALLWPGAVNLPHWLLWMIGSVFVGCIAIAIVFKHFRLPIMVSDFSDSVQQAFLAPGVMGKQVMLSLLIALLSLCAFAACARSIGTSLSLQAILILVPLILTAMLIPASVGGWGWREGAAAAVFPLAGATASAGVSVGITYGTIMMVAALPGLAWIALPSFGRRRDELFENTHPLKTKS